jgi:hypothetical protein
MKKKLLLAVLLVCLFPALAYGAVSATIFTGATTGQIEAIDPIVNPGGVAPHLHEFVGAQGITSVETSASLRGKATTWVEQQNHSAVWAPPVYEDGVRLLPATTKPRLLYYRCKHSASVCGSIQRFPENFGMVIGNANAQTPAENPAITNHDLGGWRCGTGGGLFDYDKSNTTCTAQILVGSLTGGNCLLPGPVSPANIGQQINSACTSIGGTPILNIQMYFRYKLTDPNIGTITLGGTGMPAYQWHADYLFGWEVANFENFLNQCIRDGSSCATNVNV